MGSQDEMLTFVEQHCFMGRRSSWIAAHLLTAGVVGSAES
jgi:hypothetical protein